MAAAVTDIAAEGLALSCHDISEGGLAVALAEMLLLAAPDRPAGARIELPTTGRADAAGSCSASRAGYVLEIAPASEKAARAVLERRGVRFARIGETTAAGVARDRERGRRGYRRSARRPRARVDARGDGGPAVKRCATRRWNMARRARRAHRRHPVSGRELRGRDAAGRARLRGLVRHRDVERRGRPARGVRRVRAARGVLVPGPRARGRHRGEGPRGGVPVRAGGGGEARARHLQRRADPRGGRDGAGSLAGQGRDGARAERDAGPRRVLHAVDAPLRSSAPGPRRASRSRSATSCRSRSRTPRAGS